MHSRLQSLGHGSITTNCVAFSHANERMNYITDNVCIVSSILHFIHHAFRLSAAFLIKSVVNNPLRLELIWWYFSDENVNFDCQIIKVVRSHAFLTCPLAYGLFISWAEIIDVIWGIRQGGYHINYFVFCTSGYKNMSSSQRRHSRSDDNKNSDETLLCSAKSWSLSETLHLFLPVLGYLNVLGDL